MVIMARAVVNLDDDAALSLFCEVPQLAPGSYLVIQCNLVAKRYRNLFVYNK